jgi:hypothetical protein
VEPFDRIGAHTSAATLNHDLVLRLVLIVVRLLTSAVQRLVHVTLISFPRHLFSPLRSLHSHRWDSTRSRGRNLRFFLESEAQVEKRLLDTQDFIIE